MPRRTLAATWVLWAWVALAGCTRSWPGLPPPAATTPTAPEFGRGTQSTPAFLPGRHAIVLVEPTSDQTVTSPVQVAGSIYPPPERRILAVQVRSRELADGREQLVWRGNGRLTIDAQGAFTGTVGYALPAPGPGVLEVSLADLESGTVLDSYRLAVNLAAAP